MGIKGLTSFVGSSDNVWTRVKLKDSRVIVDGSALLYYLYPSSDLRYGGQYSDLGNAIGHFFSCLRSSGVEAFVIFDGPTMAIDKKLDTVISRAKETIGRCHELSIERKQLDGKIVPPMTRLLLMQKLENLGIRFAVCDWEADQEIASLAHHWKCPVISNDSDFFIYDLQAGYIPLSELSCNEHSITARLYNRRELAKVLDIPETFLPLFASLIGNDFVGRDDLAPFERALQPCQPPNKSFRKRGAKMFSVAMFLATSTTLPEALQSVLNIVNNENEKKHLQAALSKSMVEYDICDCTLASYFELGEVHSTHEIPPYAITRYRSGSFPKRYLGAMTSGRCLLKFQVEDINEVSTNNCSKRLRQVIYGIVTKPEAQAAIHEWDRCGQGLKKQRVQPCSGVLGYDELPKLDNLQELDEEKRRHLMLSALESDTKAIHSLPDTQQLFAASIRCWVCHASPQVSMKCIQTLIAHHLQSLKEQQSTTKPTSRHHKPKRQPLTSPFDIKHQHSLAQWQSVMYETILLNQILLDAFPIPDITTLYNGVEVHTMMWYSLKQENLASTLDGFSQLYGAVTDGLAHKLQSDNVDTKKDGKSRQKDRKKTRPNQASSLLGNRFAALLCDDDDDDSDDSSSN